MTDAFNRIPRNLLSVWTLILAGAAFLLVKNVVIALMQRGTLSLGESLSSIVLAIIIFLIGTGDCPVHRETLRRIRARLHAGDAIAVASRRLLLELAFACTHAIILVWLSAISPTVSKQFVVGLVFLFMLNVAWLAIKLHFDQHTNDASADGDHDAGEHHAHKPNPRAAMRAWLLINSCYLAFCAIVFIADPSLQHAHSLDTLVRLTLLRNLVDVLLCAEHYAASLLSRKGHQHD